MDALSDVLRVIRLTGGVYVDARFTAPWCFAGRVEPEHFKPFLANPVDVIGFHYVVDGRLMAQVKGGPWVELKKGEIILFPRNAEHLLASAVGLKPEPAGEVVLPPPGVGVREIHYGGVGDETHIVCGYLGSDGADTPLTSALPPMLTLNIAETPGGEWIAHSFAFAAAQLANHEAGSATIIGRLSELMFVEAVRHYIERLPPNENGWLAGLRDPKVGRALALMHTQPHHDWTTDNLAREVSLSRSAFAEKFTTLIGKPPMRYLTSWRMQIAAKALKDGEPISRVAFDVGYDSEAAFTRAFAREMGLPPATWRQQSSKN